MLRKIRQLPIFKTVHGRHVLSLWVTKIFEKSGIRSLFGANLVAAVVFAGIVSPEADNLLNQMSLKTQTQQTLIDALIDTKTTFEIPLTNFKISQLYSYWHPGIDMTAAAGTAVYTIEAGYIEAVNSHPWGYGKHVIVNHGHNFKSLYAHLSKFETLAGRHVERGEIIGRVGTTGWSTGSHLHFEIYYQEVPVNPLEVLPIKPKEIVYDGAMWKNASASATVSTSLSAGN